MPKEAVKAFLESEKAFLGVAIGVGFIFAFGGYRFFNATLFLCAAAAAGFVSFALIPHDQLRSTLTETSEPAVVLGVIILTLAGPMLLAGILAVYVRKVGTFLAGAAGGAFFAFMVNAALLLKSDVQQIPCHVVLGVLGGMMALKIERAVIITSTSLAGSVACVAGVGKFLGHFPTSVNSFVNPNKHAVTHSAWVWAYAGAFVLMVVVSTVVQFRTGDRAKAVKEEKYKTCWKFSWQYV